MTDSNPKSAIDRFLQTGDYDQLFGCFEGANVLDRIAQGNKVLVAALLAELRSRVGKRRNAKHVELPNDMRAFAREKVSPMVRGLFPSKEVDRVVSLLEDSVVFLTPQTIEEVLLNEDLTTAWDLANLYLLSVGAKLLSDEAPKIVGLSVEAKCYVSMTYFADTEPFADYVVHEAAHVFHNMKRTTLGLPSTRNKEWLLPISYLKRETFAYACEAYSCILALSDRKQVRRENLERHKSFRPSNDQVDADEYHEILAEAIDRRNGWRTILDRCSVKHNPHSLQCDNATPP